MLEKAITALKHRKKDIGHIDDHEVNYAFFRRNVPLKELTSCKICRDLNIGKYANSIQDAIYEKLALVGKNISFNTNICYAGMFDFMDRDRNVMWIGLKAPIKRAQSRTVIVSFLRHCKKGNLLPPYLKPEAVVDSKGNISAFLDVTCNSKYDDILSLYIYLCVLRLPREDPGAMLYILDLMKIGYHPITAWLFGSKCACTTSGHNFIQLCLPYIHGDDSLNKAVSGKIKANFAYGLFNVLTLKHKRKPLLGHEHYIMCSSHLQEIGDKLNHKKIDACNIAEMDELVRGLI